MNKKIRAMITRIVLASLIFPLLCLPSAAEDMKQTKYAMATRFFTDIGIVEAMGEPDAAISRASFASLLSAVLGRGENEAYHGDFPFNDIVVGSNDYKAVAFLYSRGYVSGTGENRFRPDAALQGYEAQIMVVNTLGYKEYAQRAGYDKVAGEMGLGRLSYGEITRGEAVNYLFKALEIPMFTLNVTSSAKGAVYGRDKSSTLLSKHLNLIRFDGIFTGTEQVNTGSADIPKGSIAVDYTVYRSEITNTEDLAGQSVACYIGSDDSEKTGFVVSILPKTSNSILEVEGKDIISTNMNGLVYQSENAAHSRNAAFDANCRFVYNGKLDANINFETDFPEKNSGYVRLVDHNDDGLYDTVMIWKSEATFADGFSSYSNLITFQNGRSFDPDSGISFYLKDKYKAEMSLSTLRKNYVSTIYASKDEKTVVVYVCTDIVKGIPAEVITDQRRVIINGEAYEYAEGLNILFSRADFYLDVYGIIRRVSGKVGSGYGFIMEYGPGRSLKAALTVKMLSASGKIEVLESAEKFQLVIGTQRLSCTPTDFRDKWSGVIGEVSQLVRYSLNGDGKINELTFPDASDINTWNRSIFTRHKSPKGSDSFNDLIYNNRTVYGRNYWYGLETSLDTACFYIAPQDEKCKAGDISSVLENSNSKLYSAAYLYDIDEYGRPSVVVIDERQAAPVSTSYIMQNTEPVGIVTSKATVLDEENAQADVINLLGSAPEGTVRFTLKDSELLNANSYWSRNATATGDGVLRNGVYGYAAGSVKAGDLRPGDVIHYTVENDGSLRAFAYIGNVYDLDFEKESFTAQSVVKSSFVYVGPVANIKDGYIWFGYKGMRSRYGEEMTQTCLDLNAASSNLHVYRVNLRKRQTEKILSGELQASDTVLALVGGVTRIHIFLLDGGI